MSSILGSKRSLESISLPGEVWKSSVVDGKVHPWYSVSNKGRIASHFGNKPRGSTLCPKKSGFAGWDRSYDPEYCKILKPGHAYKTNKNPNKRNVYGSPLKVGDKIISAMRVSFRLPHDFFLDINMYGSEYQYPIQGTQGQNNGNCCQRTMAVHKLVANTHMSVDEFPPKRISKSYPYLPEDVKQWIRETVIINHIDHDVSNNCVDNLEYVTMRQNTHAAIKQYGGHFCPDQYLKHKEPFLIKEKEVEYINPLAELLGV